MPEGEQGQAPVPLEERRRYPPVENKPAPALLKDESDPPPLDEDLVPVTLEGKSPRVRSSSRKVGSRADRVETKNTPSAHVVAVAEMSSRFSIIRHLPNFPTFFKNLEDNNGNVLRCENVRTRAIEKRVAM